MGVQGARCRGIPLLLAGLGLAAPPAGCSGLGAPALSSASSPRGVYGYFGVPALDDPWVATITAWQERSRAVASRPPLGSRSARQWPPAAPDAEPTLLRAFETFRQEQRREVARRVAEWIQVQAARHFVPDRDGDRWPTFEEVLVTGADDCDGLALLAYRLLRELGFPESELYQAIVRNEADGRLHMVTLWFEDPDDPWAIDPTGAMSAELVRISAVAPWRPLELFTEAKHYAVAPPASQPGASPPLREGAAARRP